jgi:voltage-gated potassium channel
MNIRRRLLFAFVLLTVVAATAVAGYRLLGGPDIDLLDALYMAVITLAGVGYGEIIPTAHNPTLRLFNMFIVSVGVMITVYVFSVVTAFLVEAEIRNIFWRRSMQKRIRELKHHYIVCGLGDTGRYAVEELQKTHTPYVVIEGHEDSVKRFQEHAGDAFKNLLYVIGDATDEAVLDEAGVERARGLIAAVAGDKDNLVTTIMVRQKSSDIRIVARCADVKYSDRMIKAGANSTVSPNAIGGLRLASEALRPHVVGFLDLMLREKGRALRIEEIEIGMRSPWAGMTLEQLRFRARYHLLPLAVKVREDEKKQDYLFNPPETLALSGGSVVIVMGDVDEVRRARLDAEEGTKQVLGV